MHTEGGEVELQVADEEAAVQGFRMSPQQRRLWALGRGGADLPLRAWCAVELDGPMDRERLLAAVTAVAARHEILRTTFRQPEGLDLALQAIGDGPPEVRVHDWQGLAADERNARADALLADLDRRDLDPAAGPPLHADLAVLAPDRHLLALLHPALCGDAASLRNAVREIAAAYDGALPEEPPLQYADVSEWLNELLESDDLEAERHFWQRAAAAVAETPRLPFARPSRDAFAPRRLAVAAPPELAGRLANLAAERSTAVPLVLFAAWHALLGRLTGAAELSIGVLFEGRDYEGLDAAVGPFARTLPVRVEAGPALRFSELLARAEGAVSDAQAAQDAWSGGRLDAFPYAFDCEEEPAPAALGGASLAFVDQYACVDRAELKLRCVQGSGLVLELHWDGSVLDRADVERLAEQYLQVLGAALDDPEVPLGELDVLTAGERAVLLAPAEAAPEGAGDWVHRRFARQAALAPEATAAVLDGAALTYGELDARANRLAHALRRLGVGPDARVALCLGRGPEMLVAMVGTLKAGGAYAPLDPGQPRERLGRMLAELEPAVVLTESAAAASLPETGAPTLVLDTGWDAIAAESAEDPEIAVAGENLAYVIFTSGSTGRPKGVGIEHRQLANYVAAVSGRLDLPACASYALVSTFAADLGHTMIFPALCQGGSLHVLSERQLADPEVLADAFARQGIDCLKIVPSHLEGLLAACSRPAQLLPRLRLVLGGEATRRPLLARVRALAPDLRVFNHYGPTETTVGVMTHPVPAGWEDGDEAVLPLGRPLAGVRGHVLDGQRRPAPFWVAGELCVGGATVARGYLGNPAATAERFVPDPWGGPGARLYRTGDRVRVRPDGVFEFLGRVDDQVKIRGNRIEPGEVASVLAQHPGIAQATVTAWQEGQGEPKLVGYWVAARGASPEAPELRAYLAERLPAYMVPAAFVRLPALPLTANGKLDRRALPPPPEHGGEGEAFAPPRTPTEEILAGIWGEVLSLERVGVGSNFFDLGGHSLLATQVVSRVRKTFAIDLALRTLLESPTVAGLGEKVDAAIRAGERLRVPAIEPLQPGDEPPLSFAQQRLWFLDQLQPGSAAYNLPAALRLRGRLDPGVLAAALSEVVRRHQTLRATFGVHEGRAVQRIAPPAPVAVPRVDLAGLPAELREGELRRLARREAEQPFDLEAGPLLRVTLAVLGSDDHALLVTMHHIVSDGWSRGVLVREFGALYEALSAGRPSPLPELPIQYGDFAAWQRSWLSGEVLEAEIAWWRARLGDAPPPLELPTDRPRSALRTARAGHREWALEDDLHGGLQRQSRRRGATLFMTLLAGFQSLLGRYTGQADVAVGSPIAGRNQVQTEGLIGFFVNTLVLRTDLGGDPDLGTVLDRVREVTLGAYAHQDVPFEKLVSELQPERDLSRTPFFQVVFALQNAPGGALELPGLALDQLAVANADAKFDLTVMLYDDASGVGGLVEYDRDLFDPATVARLMDHFGAALRGFAADPEVRLSELPLLSEVERRQIVEEWNDTEGGFSASECLHRLFEASADRAPEAPAVVAPGVEISYGELERRANRLANRLIGLGLGPGDLVAVYLERSPETLVAVLGVLKAGAAYVPLDSTYPEARIAFILQALDVRCMVTQGSRLEVAGRLAGRTPLRDVIRLDLDGGEEPGADDSRPPARGTADDLAYVIFTSGTTGTPKGVVLRHRPVINLIEWVNRSFGVGPGDRLLFLTSLCFDLSVYDVFGILAAGGTVRVTSEEEAQDPLHLLGVLLSEPITFWDSAPAALQQLVPFLPEPGKAAGTGSLRLVFLSGDWIPVTLPDRIRGLFPRARVVALGGATEAAIWSNFHPVGEVAPTWVSIPYGRPITNARYHVLDAGLRPCPVGVAGDLYIGGGCLFSGYAQDPVLTAQKLVPDPWGTDPAGARLYRTGDRARYWADGNLEFLGRADHQVKIRGFRIELGEVEAALLQHPRVRSSAAIVREDQPGDRRLAAYYVAEPGADLAPAELRDFVAERLPVYMIPSAFVPLPNLPVTANGKLDRKALPAPTAVRADDGEEHVAPRDATGELLARIWAEVLGLERVSVHANFFELGGDSILSIQVISRAVQAGLRLTPRQLFESPTVAGLAEAAMLAGAEGEGGEEEAASGPAGPVPLTPVQRWFFEQRLAHPEHFNQALLLELDPPAGEERVDASRLAAAFERVTARHDALRLRFAEDVPGWRQFVAEDAGPLFTLEEADLAALPEVAERLQGSLDLTHGPLVRAALLRTAPGGEAARDALLVVIHHLVVDGVSWRVLLEDLEAAYRGLAEGGEPRLAPRTAPFRAWAARLEELAAAGDDSGAAFWLDALAGVPAALPLDHGGEAGPNDVASADRVSASLDAAETRALLQEAPRAYRTRADELLLAALAEAVGRWSGRRRLLVDLEGHGRDLAGDLDVSRTVGWFTAIHPVALDTEGAAGPGDAIKAVKERLRAASERGPELGLLRYLGEGEAADRLRALPRPAVVFNYLGQLDQAVAEGRLFRPAAGSAGPTRHPAQLRAHLLEVNAAVSDGRLQVSFTYSAHRHRRDTVERLAAGFAAALRELIAHCLTPGAGGVTPSDFPLARLDAATLDRIAAAVPGAVEDVYPASSVQQGMLFHVFDSPDSGVYVGQLRLELGRDLDAAAFREAWRRVIARQPILRTAFFGAGFDRPLQVVSREAEPEWTLLDWRGLAADERRERLAAFLAADRRRGFDPTRAPLLRFALIDLGEEGHLFVWTLLFVLLDGWSMPILMRELFAFYQAAVEGREARLEPARPYRDYVAWLERQDLAAAEAFWRRTLGGFDTPTPLAIDRPRIPAPGEGEHAARQMFLGPDDTEALRAFARRGQLTLNTLMQAAWALLLGRYSGERDVVFGAVTSGRSAPVPGIESIVGLFINTLPVRVPLPAGAALGPWLGGLQEGQAQVRQFEHSPLAAVQRWSGVPHGRRLFDSIVIFENFPVDDSVRHQAGRAVGMGEAEMLEQTNYPLTLFVSPGERFGVKALLETARFEPADVERMLGHLAILLAALPGDPARPLDALPLLSPAEAAQLAGWNATAVDWHRGEVLHRLIEEQAARTPDAVAVTFEGESLTYAELDRQAGRLTQALRRRGVGPDVPVGISVERSLELVMGLLAILKAGGAYVPVDPGYPAERRAFMVEDALGADGVLLTADSPDWEEARSGEPESGVEVAPEGLAYVIYTSGSTGRPKGSMNTHRAIVNRLLWMQDAYGLTADDRVLQKTPFSFDVSVWEFFWPLLVGARLVMARPDGHRDSGYLAEVIEREGVTTLHFVPSMLQVFLEEKALSRCTSLKRVFASGEALPPELVGRFFERLPWAELHNLYGPTEAAVDVTYHACTPADAEAGVPIGRPIANLEIHLLTGPDAQAPVGVPGELCIGGVGLSRGYLHRPELTAERFVPHPWADGGRLYRTGDLARYRADGEIEYLGRLDFQVKVRGVRIELGEIESALARQPGVREAAVIVRQEATGPDLAAFVTAQAGAALSPAALRESLAQALPEAMVPSAVVVLEALPLTPNGKLDRKALAELGPRPVARTEGGDAPRTPVEEILCGLFAQVLHVERAGAGDSFFDLGGHSLLATQLVSRVREAFGVELPLRTLFEAPTPARLAQRVDAAQREVQGRALPPLERVPRDRPLPLSFAQSRLWFLDQLQPGRADYNLPMALRLRGRLDPAALEATLAETFRRHESLRTTFRTVADEPVQVIAAELRPGLPVVDLSGLPAGPGREAELARLAHAEAARPFDLGRGPLLRADLVALGPDEHVLLMTLHHIVSDAWSLWVLVSELRALYEAFAAGAPSPLPEPAVQYADFAAWQRRWLDGDALATELAWWRERLAGAPPVLELPTDRPRPPVQTFRGAKLPAGLSPESSAAVRALARREGATPFMTLMAGFQALLARYAGQSDVSVGTPIAGRRLIETERLIGFFINTLVVRTDFGGDPSFRRALAQVRETALAAYAHQDVPFERLVEELQPERDQSHAPLFQVTFTFQNAPAATLHTPGLDIDVLDVETGTAKVDLLLMLFDRPERLDGFVQYGTDLFDPATIERLNVHLEALLAGALAAPDRPLSEIPLLGGAERHQVAREWNDTPAGPGEVGLPLLPDLLALWAERTPGAPAVTFEGESLSYGELDRRADRLARHLAGFGVGPDVLVGLFVEPSLEMVVGLLGVLRAGGAYVPIDPGYPEDRIEAMVADSGLLVLLTQDHLVDRLPSFWGFTVRLDSEWETIEAAGEGRLDVDLLPGHLANVIFTSGSTGQAKGVMVTHRGLASFCATAARMVRLAPGDRVLQFASLSFDAATSEVAMAAAAGATLCLAPRPALLPGPELVALLREREINAVTLPPSALAVLPEEPLPALRTLIVAGEACPPDLARRWAAGRRLVDAYGPTEGTICATFGDFDPARETLPIGRPVPEGEVLLLDSGMAPVPARVAGELHIAGHGLARGYLNRPDLTAAAFLPHPASAEPGARLYRTGDAARYLPDGTIEFVGRLDHQVKIRGFRIEPGEVEAALARLPGVREAAVVVRDLPGGKGLVGCVVAEDAEVTPASLREGLRETLPSYMVPAHFLLLPALPLTPNGKVDRAALAELDLGASEGAAERAYVAPRTPAEEVLAGIFCEVLEVERAGAEAHFFELGGHSLLGTRLVSRVRSLLGVELPVAALFDDPTLAGIARKVDAALRGGAGSAAVRPPIERVPRDRPLALSFAQQRLWFLDQMEPGGSAYNIPAAVVLRGDLDRAALDAALGEVVRRHEALRTTFAAPGGEPVQVVAPAAPVALQRVDLSALPEERRRSEAARLAAEESRRPFDLARGPLLRGSLVALGEGEEALLLTLHHIVSDGWSMNLLVDELAALYGAAVAGRPSPLPELPVQYADFAAWQRGWLRGEVLDEQIAYWRERLAGAPAALELPTDRPRPAVQRYAGAALRFRLPAELRDGLGRLARDHGATPFMVLTGAFQSLLGRWAGQDDISVGTPISGRNHLQTERLIGFFVNTLVLRSDLGGAPGLAALLDRVRTATLGAFAHQDLPFEKLVEELRPERDLSRSPLFQAMFVLNTPPTPAGFPDLALEPLEVEGTAAKFDLTLTVAEAAEDLGALLEYNRDLFEAATMARLAGHFAVLLEGAVREPERPLESLPVLTAEEAAQLAGWNATAVDWHRGEVLHRLIGEQAARTPDAVAVTFEGASLTYAELEAQAGRLARAVRRRGVGPDVPVGISVERSLELVVGLLAILKAGGAYVPVDPGYPAERRAFMVEDALGTDGVLLTADSPEWEEGRSGEPESGVEVSPEGLAYVIYTSGSTGRPKGSMNTHRAIVNRLLWMQDAYGLTADDRVLQKTPFSFDVSVWELFWPLLVGARLVVARPDGHRDSGYLAEVIEREEVTTLHFVPSMLQVFLEEKALSRCMSLKRVFASGEALPPELVGRFFERLPWAELHNLYGPTEAAVDVTYHACTPADAERGVPIGRPIANLEIHLVTGPDAQAPVGVPGELCIGGVGLSRGYLNRPELTAERFVPHPWADGGRLYRTGDLARYRADGEIEYLGRLDFQVKVRGVRIELGEIESALARQAGVREAAVIVRQEATGPDLAAFVTAQAGAALSPAALRESLARSLPEAMVPSAVVVLDALPLTPNGKLDRKALAALGGRPAARSSEGEARTPAEELLCTLFAQVLRAERVGPRDGFFELGGHSLLATQLVSRVREAFGVELPLRALFEAPTPERLARRLDAARGPIAPPIGRVPRDRPLPLSFAQQRLWFLDQLQPGRADYNLPAALRLTGRLDPGVLAAALTEIARRHESLRTTFRMAGDEPVQVVAPELRVELPVTDLSGAASPEDEVRRRVREEAAKPFDLAAGPLLRASLLALGPEEHVLLVTLHHIVGDAWSLGVLVRELRALYGAFAEGRPSPLPELAIQYADYGEWQRRWLSGDTLAAEIGYWRERLAGMPPALELPADRPRPAIQTFGGESHSFQLPERLSRDVAAFSRERGATLFMTLLGAFQTLLCRYSGQEDFALGTPIAGRNQLQTEELIGFFVNTLVLRAELADDPAFGDLLGRVRDGLLADYAHQDLPFEKLVEELQPARALNHAPLFQVMFVLQNAPTEALEVPGLRLEALPLETTTAKMDLVLFMAETPAGLQAKIEYATDLFERATIRRLAGHLETLLAGIVEDADRRLSDLPLLSPAETAQVVAEWNDSRHGEGWPGPVHASFRRWAERSPEAPAVVCGGETLSYGEVAARAARLAARLRALGVGPEVPVGLAVEPSPAMIVGLLGILEAGGSYVPLDPTYPPKRLQFMLEDSGAPLVLTQEKLRPNLEAVLGPSGRRILALDAAEGGEPVSANPAAEVGPDNAVYTIYTSGSTGTPKGVMATHGGLANFSRDMAELLDLGPGDRMLEFASLSFDASVLQIFPTLVAGAALVLHPQVRNLSVGEINDLCTETGVTVIDLPPALTRQWIAEAAEGAIQVAAPIRFYLTGGEGMPASSLVDWARRVPPEALFLTSYGPTEATVTTTTFQIRAGDVGTPEFAEVPVGRPLEGARVHLLDRHLRPVPPGVPGEMFLGGAGLTRGYLHRPDLTAERWVPDPLGGEPGARLYRTGDLARYRADGNLQFLGRADGQIKLRGFRIELGEIEAAISAFPGVRESAVLLLELAGDRKLVAWFEPQPDRSGEDVDTEALRASLVERLPGPLIPAAFVRMDALPRFPSGKLDRRALPAPSAPDFGPAEAVVAPRTPAEATLAAIWAEVLGVPEVSVASDFFALGGHSLLATQVVSRARRAFGREVPLRLVFELRTIERMAEALEGATPRAAEGPAIERIEGTAGDLDDLLSSLEDASA